MKKTFKMLLVSCALLPGLAAAQSVVGEMDYAPLNTTGVPGLNSVMIVVLAVLIFTVSFRALRRRTSGPLMSIFGAALVTGLLSLAGGQLISDSMAIQPNWLLSNPNGGSIVVYGGINNNYENTSGVTLKILGVSQGVKDMCDKDSSTCTEGFVLAPGATCNVNCPPPSDIRLKRDINFITELDNGIKVYSFKYVWSDETYVGVMAQDLLADSRYADAVRVMGNGYYAVDYSGLGIDMMTLDEWHNSGH